MVGRVYAAWLALVSERDMVLFFWVQECLGEDSSSQRSKRGSCREGVLAPPHAGGYYTCFLSDYAGIMCYLAVFNRQLHSICIYIYIYIQILCTLNIYLVPYL
jgi:hypothetical protein